MSYWSDHKIDELIGKTLVKVSQIGDDRIEFTVDDGSQYWLYHEKSCCEYVTIESIVGDLNDLVGSPITMAEEVVSDTNPPDANPDTIEYQDSFTWTFYKLATVKGYVTIRWYGGSNGYYSESVDVGFYPANAYTRDADKGGTK